MELKTERLILYMLTWDHLEKIHQLNSHPEVEKFNTIGIPENLDVTRELIRPAIEDQKLSQRKNYGWAICLKDSTFIGKAGLSLSENRKKMAEIHYSLVPEYWGKGYATEVVNVVIKFGFETLKLHRIEAGTATENLRSIRVLEKAGMIREGIRRKILPIRGAWKDNFHYAILEDDSRIT